MTARIIEFNGITKLDIDVDRMLENTKGRGFTGVVILGFDADEQEYFASSIADGGTVLWLLEKCKKALLEMKV